MRTTWRVRLELGLALATFFGARSASATTALEVGENGSEMMGRGGAWVARASDPLATFYNPAGLAGQETRFTMQGNINILNTCFTRLKATNDATARDGNPNSPNSTVPAGTSFPQTCNSYQPTPLTLLDPQIGFTYRFSPRIGIGFAIVAPSAAASQNWPATLSDGSPGPQRYLLISGTSVLVTPTLGVGWEPIDRFRIGASLIWGIASLDFANNSWASNSGTLGPNGQPTGGLYSPANNDVRGEVKVSQLFIPGFTLGTIWSPTDQIDIAGWYKFMSSIDAKGSVDTQYGTGKNVVNGSTTESNCGNPQNPPGTCFPNVAELKVPIPMEAKIGFRFHKLRAGADMLHRRDPMSQDVFDLEADLTWANNSAFKAIEISFPADANGLGKIPVNGTPGNLPPDGSIPHNFQDVFGARFGGDVNVIPDQLAIRAGAYIQSAAQPSQYQNIDFVGQTEFGLALGETTRIHLSHDPKALAIELSLGFGHTFIATSVNNGPNGIAGLSGTQCNTAPGTVNPSNGFGPCPDGGKQYRTAWPVNLGTITNSFNQINLGGTIRF